LGWKLPSASVNTPPRRLRQRKKWLPLTLLEISLGELLSTKRGGLRFPGNRRLDVQDQRCEYAVELVGTLRLVFTFCFSLVFTLRSSM